MKYTTLYTLILGLFSIGWTDCPEDFMERMQRPGHSEIQLSKVMISGRVLDESGFPLAGATIQEKETANGAIAGSEGKFTLVGYQLPAAWMEKTKVLKRAQLSFSGRNLFFFYKKAPFDPDLVLSTGNDNQGIEVYGMPTTRSWGFSLKCEF